MKRGLPGNLVAPSWPNWLNMFVSRLKKRNPYGDDPHTCLSVCLFFCRNYFLVCCQHSRSRWSSYDQQQRKSKSKKPGLFFFHVHNLAIVNIYWKLLLINVSSKTWINTKGRCLFLSLIFCSKCRFFAKWLMKRSDYI